MSVYVAAFDPGARAVGVAVVCVGATPDADRLVHHAVVLSGQTGKGQSGTSVCGDLDYQRATRHAVEDVLVALGAEDPDGTGVRLCWAVEDVTSPPPFIGGRQKNVRPHDVMALAFNAGIICSRIAAYGPAHMVRANRNGSGPLISYPRALMTDREAAALHTDAHRPAGQSADIRHARSAYDVARTTIGDLQLRTQVRRATATQN